MKLSAPISETSELCTNQSSTALQHGDKQLFLTCLLYYMWSSITACSIGGETTAPRHTNVMEIFFCRRRVSFFFLCLCVIHKYNSMMSFTCWHLVYN